MYCERNLVFIIICLLSLTLSANGETAHELQVRLNQSIANGERTFTIYPGDYYFNSNPFTIANAKNMDITANGATVWFQIGSGVLYSESQNVMMKGLTIDYDPPCYFQGTVTQNSITSGNQVIFPVYPDKGFMAPDVFIKTYSSYDGGNMTGPIFFDPKTEEFLPGQTQWASTIHINDNSNGTYLFSVENLHFKPLEGQKVIVVSRIYYTHNIKNSSRIVTDNVTIHGASYMAFTEFDGEGGNIYRNIKLVRKPGNLIAANADAFHSSGCKYGPTIQDSELSYSIDDFFNVHNTFQIFCSKVASNSLLVIDPHIYKGEDNSMYGTSSTFTNLVPGATLSFYSINDTLQYLTKAVVRSVEHITDQETIQFCEQVHEHIQNPPYNVQMLPYNVHLYRVNFTKPLPASVKPYVFLNYDDWQNVGAVIKNNYFHHSYANLGRWKSSGGMITNNTFHYARLANLEVTPLRYWMEGPLLPKDIAITDNTITGDGTDPIHISYAQNVKVSGNKFFPTKGK